MSKLVRWASLLMAFMLSAATIARTRRPLAEQYQELEVEHDVYGLPSPEQTRLLSLGYSDALADLLYAHVLVSYGIHFQEKRRFEFVGEYLDVINELAPRFRQPYRFADTLLTLQPVAPRAEDYVKARAILERGMEQFPYDAKLWLTGGQFIAYLGPGHLESPEAKAEWRLAGARRLSRACEMVGDDQALPYHCITAAGLLSRSGERAAVIEFLERVLTVTDDDKVRQLALGWLRKHYGEQQGQAAELRSQRLNDLHRQFHPVVSKDQLFVLSPPFEPAGCAGPTTGGGRPGCAATWRTWSLSAQR